MTAPRALTVLPFVGAVCIAVPAASASTVEAITSAALALEDECGDGTCALSALQLRAAKWREGEDEEWEVRWRQFERFRLQLGRHYGDDEAVQRFRNFETTLKHTQELNKRNGEDVFGVTYSADFFEEERPRRGLQILRDPLASGLEVAPGEAAWQRWQQSKLGATSARAQDMLASLYTRWRLPQASNSRGTVPAAINWRLTRAVTPVKNQGSCGACWAISVAEEVESMFVLYGGGGKNGYSETFSAQQLASCVEVMDGCGGGNPVPAYQYLMRDDTVLVQDVFWPYEGGLTPEDGCVQKSCTPSCSTHNVTTARRYEHLIGPYAVVKNAIFAVPPCSATGDCESQDLEGLARALVMYGPISVAVNAGHWLHYKSGVVTRKGCGGITVNDLNHAVQLVGYNTSADKPYWILRNQWSTAWGDYGYIYLEYGQNTCGLANLATVPILKGMVTPKASQEEDDPTFVEVSRAPGGLLGGHDDAFASLYRQALGEVTSEDEEATAEAAIAEDTAVRGGRAPG